MLKRFSLAAIVLLALLVSFGCGSNPVSPTDNSDLETFFAGVSPNLTGVVGDYTFTGNDGSFESGQIIADENGNLTMVSERGASAYSNFWFNIDVEYLNPRGYTGMGLPYYYIGDEFTYKVIVDYKRGVNLSHYPWIYAKLTASQLYYPSLDLLPGDSKEVWDPFPLKPFEYKEVYDDFKIVSGTIPGNNATYCTIDMMFVKGCFKFCIASGVCGLWDP